MKTAQMTWLRSGADRRFGRTFRTVPMASYRVIVGGHRSPAHPMPRFFLASFVAVLDVLRAGQHLSILRQVQEPL